MFGCSIINNSFDEGESELDGEPLMNSANCGGSSYSTCFPMFVLMESSEGRSRFVGVRSFTRRVGVFSFGVTVTLRRGGGA